MTGDVASIATYLLGPNGGLVAIGFGLGAAGGWHFNHRTSYRQLERQLAEQRERHERQMHERDESHRVHRDECDRRLIHLETRLDEANRRTTQLEEDYRAGLQRALAQMRDSAERLTGRVDRGQVKPMDEL